MFKTKTFVLCVLECLQNIRQMTFKVILKILPRHRLIVAIKMY